MAVSAKLRRLITARAGFRCEYCRLSSSGQAATFHIDHIVPQCAGGETTPENLALACIHCSLRKGSKRKTADPKTGNVVRLLNPRIDSWSANFRWDGVKLIGRTAIGRATVEALALNSPDHLIIRGFEARLGRHPAE